MTRSIPTAARGDDTNGLRHLHQGSVGDGKHWITVIQGSHWVIDLNFVYTLLLFAFNCLYRHVIYCLY